MDPSRIPQQPGWSLEEAVQNDATYLAIMVSLFAMMFALVKVCDLIIGSDEAAMEELGGDEPDTGAGAGDDRALAA